MKELGLVAQTGKRGNVRVCARAQRKAPRRGGARFEVAVRTLTSPEAAPYSTAHVSGAMTRLSQAPVFVLTAHTHRPHALRWRLAPQPPSADTGSTDDKVAAAIATPSSTNLSDFMKFMGTSFLSRHGFGQSPYTVHCDSDQAHRELSVPVPEPAGGGFESLQRPITGTGGFWLRCLGSRNSVSRKRRLSHRDTVRLEGYNAASPRIWR